MRAAIVLGAVVVVTAGCSSLVPTPVNNTATAEIRTAAGAVVGTATLTEVSGGVRIVLEAKGLPPGVHGVHLHEVGKCEAPFTSAGGHFDPGQAGNSNPDANHPFHMGDLPQISASASGTAVMRVATTRVTLSDGPLSLFDADGSAIIIHGNPDQGITGEPKSGVSGGPRVACGVIEKR